jgi:hypothetical protein
MVELLSLSQPLKAVADEANALTHMMEAVMGAHFDAAAAARQTVVQSLQAACVQAHITPSDDVTPEDLAQVGMNALRNLVLADQTLDVAIYILATELYSIKIWLALGMDSWDEYVDAALVEGEQADKWKAQLSQLPTLQQKPGELISAVGIGRDPDKVKHWLKRSVPTVLYNAKEHPVELEDGTTVDHVWLANHEPSITAELTPMASKLDMSKPDDVTKFQEALTVAAEQPREALREFKRQKGYMNPKIDRIELCADLVEIIDVSSGEITHEWRVPEMAFATEADWNFYWMALSRRYGFSVTTKTEKINDKRKPKSKRPATDRSRRGRGQSAVHSMSGRDRKRE